MLEAFAQVPALGPGLDREKISPRSERGSVVVFDSLILREVWESEQEESGLEDSCIVMLELTRRVDPVCAIRYKECPSPALNYRLGPPPHFRHRPPPASIISLFIARLSLCSPLRTRLHRLLSPSSAAVYLQRPEDEVLSVGSMLAFITGMRRLH